jgi:hypothetical protein
MIRTSACVAPSGWWYVCETASSLPSLDVPSVNQRSSSWLCLASKTVTVRGSSRTVAAWANVTPCLAILASALRGSQVGFYNTRRPHQALGMKTPAMAFALAA